jgi:hypothetical protein
MPQNTIPDLAEEIVRFLESLPDTIRTEILYSTMMYANDEDSMETETYLPKIKNKLTKTGGLKRMSATIRAIGALDFILQRSVDQLIDQPRFTDVLSEKRPDLADRMRAKYPLALKHTQAALSSWMNLRSNVLNHANLVRYEGNLQLPGPLR